MRVILILCCSYMDVKSQLDENQQKQYEWEQDQISHMKEYIARFGHGSAKLAKQAQSKEKTLAKMQAGGLTEKVVTEKTVKLHFHQCGSLPPPVLQFTNVTFGYTPDKILYSKLDFGVDLDSRIALVGPNGAGKSTLLKLMVHELECLDGIVRRHPHLRIARFHQHLTDLLDPELTPLEYIIKEFSPMEPTVARSQIGRFGITGDAQTAQMKNLSDGQKSRVSGSSSAACETAAKMSLNRLLCLRLPSLGSQRRNRICCCWTSPLITWTSRPLTGATMHRTIQTTNPFHRCTPPPPPPILTPLRSLARAINEFDGGCVLVSHDFRLIQQASTARCRPAAHVVGRHFLARPWGSISGVNPAITSHFAGRQGDMGGGSRIGQEDRRGHSNVSGRRRVKLFVW